MRRGSGALLTAGTILTAALAPPPALPEVKRDPRAAAVADAVEKAISGDGGWQSIAGLKFAFTVVRDGKTVKSYDHVWDTRAGRYRVEGDGPDGATCVVIFDVASKRGDAWALEKPASAPGETGPGETGGSANPAPRWVKRDGEAAGKLLEYGYGRFINDTYWLLMPLKMKDPGVNLDYDGEKTLDGETYDVVKLTFEGVGLTPGDTYWVYVNRKNHLVDRWEFVLQGQEAKERSAWIWKDWESFGRLCLSTVKARPDGKASIVFTGLQVLTEIPPGAFDPPR